MRVETDRTPGESDGDNARAASVKQFILSLDDADVLVRLSKAAELLEQGVYNVSEVRPLSPHVSQRNRGKICAW